MSPYKRESHQHLPNVIVTQKATLQERPSKGISLLGSKGGSYRAEKTMLRSKGSTGCHKGELMGDIPGIKGLDKGKQSQRFWKKNGQG